MKKLTNYLIVLTLAVFTFTSCEDVPSPFGTVAPPKSTTSETQGTGTESDPFNIAAAVEKCKEIGTTESSEKYYVKGIAVTEATVDVSYGNISFNMADNVNGTVIFKAFQVAGSDWKKLPSGFKINIGDEVIVYGPIYNYSGNTPETAGKSAAYIVTVNGKKTQEGGSEETGEAKGTGTESDPFNIAAAIAKCKEIGATESTDKYYIKGIVTKEAKASGGYGNITFDMGDTKDSNTTFKAYQVAGSDGEKLADGFTVNAGDEVVVYGPIYNYSGNTPETAGKSVAQIVTINGKKTSESGSTTPDEGESKKVSVAEFLAASESTSVWYQLTGTVTHLEDGTYNNSTKYGNFDLVDETGSIYVYGVVTEKGGAKGQFADLMAAKGIKDGCKITIIGNRGSYKETAQVVNAYFVSVEAGSGDGGSSTGASSYSMDFKTNGIGSWTLTDKTKPSDIDAIWKYNSKYGMVATAYVNSTNYASESWIISPKFDLSGATKATLTLHHAINFFTSVDVAKTEVLIKVSTDGTNWTNLTLTGWPEKLGWTFFDSTADFSSYAGKKDVQIAFVYTSTAEKAGTWEIEKVTIE